MSLPAENQPALFKGSFHFVNHDAKNMRALPHRRAVFTHVQNKYRTWEKREKTRQLYESSKAPSTSVTVLQSDAADDQGDKSPGVEEQEKTRQPTSAVVTDLIGGRRGIPKHNGTATFRRGQIPIESPTNLVQRGNSDPFDTYAIPVDPMVNGLLSFYRDSVMPTMFQGPVAARAANAGWMDCVDSLEDKGSAFGFLARCSAAAVIVAPNTDMASQAFIYQARSMASLRSVLAGGAPVRSFRTYSQINMLFAAEVMAKNLRAAQVHGRILARLLEEQSKTEMVDLRLLTNILFDDVNLSAMFLIRPTFDTSEWVPRMYGPVIMAGQRELPPVEGLSIGELDASIKDEALRSIFISRRQNDAIWIYLMANGIQHSLIVGLWLTARSMLQCTNLVNFYLDTADILKAPSINPQWSRLQAYIALATLYFIRITRFSPILDGVRLYDAGPTLSEALRRLLMEEEEDGSDYASSQNARLWALYVGAQAEQMPIRNRPEPTTAWFNTNFAVQARSMGLLSWQAVRAVLQRFLFSDQLQPHGSQWFFKTMSSTLDVLDGRLSIDI